MKISNTLIDLIKEFEGFEEHAYLCPAGVWTVGYGSTRKADGSRVGIRDQLTEPQALELLLFTLKSYEAAVNSAIKVTLTQNQFDALVDFAYNLGSPSLLTSTLLRLVNGKANIPLIQREFMKWDKAKVNGQLVSLPGLTRRRKAEADLYGKV
jgi:lysozyme